jgi:hypothetical protein
LLLLLSLLLLIFLPEKEGRNADENDTNTRDIMQQRRGGKCCACVGGETREKEESARSRGHAFLSAARDYDARERIFGKKKRPALDGEEEEDYWRGGCPDDLNVNIYIYTPLFVVWW